MYVEYSNPDKSIILKPTDKLGFFGSTFGQSINVGEYQDVTACSGSFPNVKYVDSTHCDFGTGTQLLTQVPFNACTLRLRLQSGSLSAVRLSAVQLTCTGAPKIGVANVYGFEKGNSTWTHMSGSFLSAPLNLASHTASGSYVHDYYVCLSMSPTQLSNIGVSLSLHLTWY